MKSKGQETPRMFVSGTQDGLIGVRRIHKGDGWQERQDPGHPLARQWKARGEKELGDYLRGRVRSFSIPYDLRGLTPFTHAVLRAASQIPYGEVRSYRWIAKRIGRPRATRAVGNALARNPVPILIPCHRVVCSDGTLGGYALGLQLKRKLLEMEKSNLLSVMT